MLSTVTIKVVAQGKHTTDLHMHEVMGRENPVGPKRKEPKASIQQTYVCMGL